MSIYASYILFIIFFTTPSSIIVLKISFNIIKIIGPINKPINPDILNPVYIAIKVNIGCIPILLLTILGSKNCLTTSTITYKTIKHIPNVILPLHAEIIAHGVKTVPAPNIGNASTNAITIAIINGNFTSNPTHLKIYNPN